METHHTKLYAIFNSVNKQWIGWSFSPQIQNSNLLVKEIRSAMPVNLQTLSWKGDYDNGELVDSTVAQKATVLESTLVEQKYSVLFRLFPPMQILETLIQQIAQLDHSGIIIMNDEMKRLADLHRKLNTKFVKDVVHFQNSPDHIFISQQQENNMNTSAFTIE